MINYLQLKVHPWSMHIQICLPCKIKGHETLHYRSAQQTICPPALRAPDIIGCRTWFTEFLCLTGDCKYLLLGIWRDDGNGREGVQRQSQSRHDKHTTLVCFLCPFTCLRRIISCQSTSYQKYAKLRCVECSCKKSTWPQMLSITTFLASISTRIYGTLNNYKSLYTWMYFKVAMSSALK